MEDFDLSDGAVDWRLSTIRNNARHLDYTVKLGERTIETVYIFTCGGGGFGLTKAIEQGLSGYWKILNCTASIFSAEEWLLLMRFFSVLEGRTAAEAASAFEDQFFGDDWQEYVLEAKRLLPCISKLSATEFQAFRDILLWLHNTDSEDPTYELGHLLPSLRTRRAPRAT